MVISGHMPYKLYIVQGVNFYLDIMYRRTISFDIIVFVYNSIVYETFSPCRMLSNLLHFEVKTREEPVVPLFYCAYCKHKPCSAL